MFTGRYKIDRSRYPFRVIIKYVGYNDDLEQDLLSYRGLWFRDIDWTDQTEGSTIEEYVYFEKEEEAILFALKWS